MTVLHAVYEWQHFSYVQSRNAAHSFNPTSKYVEDGASPVPFASNGKIYIEELCARSKTGALPTRFKTTAFSQHQQENKLEEAPLGRGVNFEIKVKSIDTLHKRFLDAGWPLYREPRSAGSDPSKSRSGCDSF